MNRDFAKVKLIIFDFDGVFTDNMVYVNQNGEETVRCSRADGIGLAKMKELGIKLLVLSTEENKVVTERCKKLKIDCIQGCVNKKDALIEILSKMNINQSEVAFVGNDLNDLDAMKVVAFPITVSDAYPEIKEIAIWCTQRSGGNGAVREICDTIYGVLKAYGQTIYA